MKMLREWEKETNSTLAETYDEFAKSPHGKARLTATKKLTQPNKAAPAAPLADTSAGAAQSSKRASARKSKRNRSPNDKVAPEYAY